MSDVLASFGSPCYFAPTSGAEPTVDYENSLMREVQRKLGDFTGGLRAFMIDKEQIDHLGIPVRLEAYEAQFEAIERLRLLPANWSTSPTEAPNAEQTQAAQIGLIKLYLTGIAAPKIMLLDGGTLAAYWRRGMAYASIDFDTDGEYPWSAAKGHDIVSGIWAGGPLPDTLRDVIVT